MKIYIVAVALFLQVNSSYASPACYQDAPGSFPLTNTGCISQNFTECVSICNSIERQVNNSLKWAILTTPEKHCLCSNVSSLSQNGQCGLSYHCDTLSEVCQIESYFADLLSVGGNYNIWFVLEGPLIVGDGPTITIYTGGQTASFVFTVADTVETGDVSDRGYKTSVGVPTLGYYLLRATLTKTGSQEEVSTSEFHYASRTTELAGFTNYTADQTAIEINVEVDVYLNIDAGSNMSVEITTDNSPGVPKIFNGVDVYAFVVGSKEVEEKEFVPHGSLIIVPSLVAAEESILASLNVRVKAKGTFKFLILRPICPNGYSISIQDCKQNTNVETVDLLTSPFTKPPKANWTSMKLQVVYTVVLDFYSGRTGLRREQLGKYNLKVNKNDMFALVGNAGAAEIRSYESTEKLSYGVTYEEFNMVSGKTFNVSDATSVQNIQIPVIVLIFSKRFNYKETVSPTALGEFKVKANVQAGKLGRSPAVNITEEKIYKVQERISGLKFIDNFPVDNEYSTTDGILHLKATVEKGSEVEYTFQVSGLNLEQKTTVGEVKFDIITVGLYTVEVYAKNLISFENIQIPVRFLEPIIGTYISIDKALIFPNDTVNVLARIVKGSSVTMEIDFGDGSAPFVETIEDVKNSTDFNKTHIFTKCSKYQIKVRVKNDLTTGAWETFSSPYNDTASLYVLCPFQEILIDSDPAMSSQDHVEFTMNKTLKLDISLDGGTYAYFELDWGDGTKETVNQSATVQPTPFTRQHQYRNEGAYNVTVNVSNFMESMVKTFSVMVGDCPAPDLTFTYGTATKRLEYFRSASIEVKALWQLEDELNCKQEVVANYSLVGWNLQKVQSPNKVSVASSADGLQFQFNRIVYTIASGLPAADYDLTLTMDFRGKRFIYTGYFSISNSKLVAHIVNEQYQTIPFKRKDEYGNVTFYHFTMDGSASHDPDESDLLNQNLAYEWQCRVLTNETFVNKSREVRLQGNSTLICLNRVLDNGDVVSTDEKPQFFTESFLEDVEYEFRLTVTKDARTSVAKQIVYLSKGSPPQVTLTCVYNCDDKINTAELMAFKLAGCEEYTDTQLFSSVWTSVLDSTGENVIEPQSTDGNCYRHNLLIQKNTLEKSENYTFTLKINFFGDLSNSYSKIHRQTSETPHGGKCEFEGPHNITASSSITVSCKDWKSIDTPIAYTFFQNPTAANSTVSPFDKPGRAHVRTFVPTIGDSSSSYLNVITVRVANVYNQYEEVTLKAYVNPTKEKIDPEALLDKIPLSSTQEIANMALMLSTLSGSPNDNANGDGGSSENGGTNNNNGGGGSDGNGGTNTNGGGGSGRNGGTNTNGGGGSGGNGGTNNNNGGGSTGEEESTTASQGNAGTGDGSWNGYGGIPLEESESEKEEQRKQEEEKQRQMVLIVDTLTKSIGINTHVDIQALTTSANVVGSISSNGYSGGGDTLDVCGNALNTITDAAIKLFSNKNSDKSISRGNVDSFAVTMVNMLSTNINVIQKSEKNAVAKIDDSSELIGNEKAEKKSNETVKLQKRSKEIRDTTEKLLDAVTSQLLPGEEVKKIRSNKMDVFIQKLSSLESLSNTTFSSSDGSEGNSAFHFKNVTGFFNDSITGPISAVGITYKSDVYPNITGSENVASNYPTFSLKVDSREISIRDTPNPILIQIENKPENLQSEDIPLYIPGKLHFHSMLVKPECNLLLRLKAVNDYKNATRLNVFIQYGKPPSSVDYDVKVTLTSTSHAEATINSGFVTFNQTSSATNQTTQITKARQANAQFTIDQTLVMWQFDTFTYGDLNVSKLYFAFSYEGDMPPLKVTLNSYNYDRIESRGSYNYSLLSYCSQCAFVNTSDTSGKYSWSSAGCRLLPEHTNLSMTSCECNHLTTFGSFYVKPNPLKAPTLAMLKSGYVLLVTVATILLLYIVGLIFTRKADNADNTKIGVSPLPDNKPEDKYLYEITVNTGSRRRAGTTSNVYFRLGGDLDESGTRVLKDTARECFQRSSSDVFVMATPLSLGDVSYLRVWHDNSGGGWYLRSIEVIDLQTEQKFIFIASRWLSVDQDDGQVDVMVRLAGALELKDFNYIFASKARRDLSDAHIWFSIYARPPRSQFTRCQRLSVAISLLLTSMTASCMFYGSIPEGNPADENRIGTFSFKWQQVYVAIISACITLPINVILIGLFRSIRPPQAPQTDNVNSTPNPAFEVDDDVSEVSENSPKHHMDGSSPSGDMLIEDLPSSKKSEITCIDMVDQTETTKEKKEPFYLPHWVLYPTWVFCVCVILGSAFMVVWYGMMFGNKKSLEWLSSVSIGLVQDIMLIQPLKVFLAALFVAVVIKRLDDEERSEVEKQVKTLAKNESWLHKFKQGGSIFDRADDKVFEPPSGDNLAHMKEVRMKELKIKAISREIMLYMVFTAVVFLLGFLTRDYQSFYQTRDLQEMMHLKVRETTNLENTGKLPYTEIISQEMAWDWLEHTLVPELFPDKWYTLSKMFMNDSRVYEFPQKLYLNDLNSKVVTGIRLRQLRVKRNTCNKVAIIAPFVPVDCLGKYSTANELKRDFGRNWTKPTNYHIKINPRDMPWRYQTWDQLDGYPILAELDTYFGGGYVVELFPRWDNRRILSDLRERRWLDRQTRAMIIEYAIYNGNTNYFDSIVVIFEFPPGGGVVHYQWVTTFRLYRYTDQLAFFHIVCEVMFILFMLLFTIREARVMYKEKFRYFIEFWNLVEFTNIILSILAVVFYFYRDVLAKRLLSRLPEKEPNVFINLQFAAYWDLTFTYIVALISFFVTLKFIKLLRFNRRISMLSSTLKRAWYPLLMFGILFGIVLIAFTFSATIIFGKALYGYRDNLTTFSSIVSLLLGKFSYDQFNNTNRVLGPVFFFLFNFKVNWIIMSMYISILNDVLSEVQGDVKLQDNDHEMVDYMLNNLKAWLGMQSKSTEEIMQTAWQEKEEEKVANKVSRHRQRSYTSFTSSRGSLSSIKSFDRESIDENLGVSVPKKVTKFERRVNEKMKKYGDKTAKWVGMDLNYLEMDDYFNDKETMATLDKFVKCLSVLNVDSSNDSTKKKKNKAKKSKVEEEMVIEDVEDNI